MIKGKRIATLALALCAVVCAACSGQSGASDDLLVFAAASLTDSMAEVVAAFEAAGGAKTSVSYGPSQALAQQIASGAPADLYVAAGKPPMDFLQEGGHIADEPVLLLSNRIVLAAAPQLTLPATIAELATAPGVSRIAVTDPDISPAGNYTKTALQNLGLWEALQSRLVIGNDVRSIMAYVQTGNADAAFVYQTDARIAPELVALDIVPADAYPAVVYPAAVVGGSENREGAQALLDFLQSEDAKRIFRKHGFTPLD